MLCLCVKVHAKNLEFLSLTEILIPDESYSRQNFQNQDQTQIYSCFFFVLFLKV